MAAGLGSRFGEGIKQLTPILPSGELIIDYSVYDAVNAGFDKIVFVIRRDIEKDFREAIGDRLKAKSNCEIEYVFQDMNDLPDGFSVPRGRTKPWGTGQAVLACKNAVDGPFAVINADDYYGREAFYKMHEFLVSADDKEKNYCMMGFSLKNTLSENGGVTRGICRLDENGNLVAVEETSGLSENSSGEVTDADGNLTDPDSRVSMNMWGLNSSFMNILENRFGEFLKNLGDNALKAEYLLPIIIDDLIKNGEATVKMLETEDKWYGVTYSSDKDYVSAALKKLADSGMYKF